MQASNRKHAPGIVNVDDADAVTISTMIDIGSNKIFTSREEFHTSEVVRKSEVVLTLDSRRGGSPVFVETNGTGYNLLDLVIRVLVAPVKGWSDRRQRPLQALEKPFPNERFVGIEEEQFTGSSEAYNIFYREVNENEIYIDIQRKSMDSRGSFPGQRGFERRDRMRKEGGNDSRRHVKFVRVVPSSTQGMGGEQKSRNKKKKKGWSGEAV
jgi:hypothetical protein